ncbi:hypothetical protein [Alkaliphilus serpentinus]|uniref:Uncharacterized protein n=1 Tax=Alkaliphilus serpentinus TaxID=1482731 RepID=A0A833M5Y0_9FIRM|nr:hypothetical protein [Alkaliphilus serpentinus]KAB3525611.1 hypothetical protein F8153_15070 [Alkaliphilus serpentinus]
MGNKLITFNEIQRMYCKGIREISLTGGKILTPGAKDFALERGMTLSYEEKMTKKPQSDMLRREIKESIEAILKNEYEILQQDKIDEITTRVMKHLPNKLLY